MSSPEVSSTTMKSTLRAAQSRNSSSECRSRFASTKNARGANLDRMNVIRTGSSWVMAALPAGGGIYGNAMRQSSGLEGKTTCLHPARITATVARIDASTPWSGAHPFGSRKRKTLFQLAGNAAERAGQRGADRVHGGDDQDRDSRRDEGVFDGSRAGLIVHKTQNKLSHRHPFEEICRRNGGATAVYGLT
jgi:hypothetical protein